MSNGIFTIGHSNHSIERFLELLRLHSIDVLADVRSQPYSRRFPDFSSKALKQHAANASVRYAYFGDALGARPDDPACYTGGIADFGKIRSTPRFSQAMARIYDGAERFRVCLLCAEKDPAQCHRAILVAQSAHQAGKSIMHIRADGTIEDHSALLARISGSVPGSASLFGDEELHAAALRRQEKRIAYTPEDAEGDE